MHAYTNNYYICSVYVIPSKLKTAMLKVEEEQTYFEM